MTTLRKYLDVVKAEMDKSLLEAAGIPAFIAGENSAAIGYGNIFGEVHLQVQDADVDRARQVLQDNQEATPLSDDFVPPETTSPEAPRPKVADSDSTRTVLSAVVTLVVVLVMFAAFGLWKTSHSASAYFRSGYNKWTKGNLDGAIADFDRAIELNSRYAHAYTDRGLAKWDKGDSDGALVDFNRAIDLDSKDTHAYDNRGAVKQLKGDLDGALVDINQAIELDPKNARAYDNRGSVEHAKGNLDSALADFDRSIELDPKYAHAYANRGSTKGAKGDLDGALVDFDKAIELNPKYTHAYENRGFTKRMKGDLDGALADYDRAIILDPKFVTAYNSRGFTKRMKGDLNGALAAYSQAIALDPKNTSAHYGHGVIYYDERNWSDALADFREASTEGPTIAKSGTMPDYSHIRIWMARSKLGERNEATEELKQYLLRRTVGKPNDWPSTIARFLTGDVSESDFLKAADSGDEKQTRNQRCDAYFYAGTLRLIDGDKSTAADYFNKCLETGAKDHYEYQSAAAEVQFLKSELPNRQN
ncbi:MAG TPA: tetratricopeptide repeat protein [Verrucomicrobiae bacterium]|nr:tetratricopeptide repeat protein [Verrucomicrobiae bacterium]